MEITYTWKITEIKSAVIGESTVIAEANWEKIGTDEQGNSGRYADNSKFDLSQIPTDYEFISFESLSEQIVLDWVQKLFPNGFEEFHINEQIKKQIIDKRHQIIDTKLPWDI
jgi:hypothetical protein